MLLRILFFLSLYSLFFSFAWSNAELSKLIKQSEKFFSEQLYEDASQLYSQSLTLTKDDELKTQLTMRLAHCWIEEKHSHAAIRMLSPLNENFCQLEKFYLLGLCEKNLGNIPHALDLLKNCFGLTTSLKNQAIIQLEKGHLYFLLGDFSNAQLQFQSIRWVRECPLPYYLAMLLLAKVQIATDKIDHSLQTLLELEELLPTNHPLYKELLYLKGCNFYFKKEFVNASDSFERLLFIIKDSKSNKKERIEILKGILASDLQAISKHPPSLDSMSFLSKIHSRLDELIDLSSTGSSHILLIDFLFFKAKHFNDRKSYLDGQELFNNNYSLFSQEQKEYLLLKNAETAPTFLERRVLYDQLLTFSASPQFLNKVHFFNGLNYFQEAMRQRNESGEKTNDLFEQAESAFEKILHLDSDIDFIYLNTFKKFLILSKAFQSNSTKAMEAWKLLQSFLEKEKSQSNSKHYQELCSICAWMAFKFTQDDFLHITLNFLQQAPKTVNWSPQMAKLEGQILLRLGEWSKAEDLFFRLIQEHSDPLLTPEALFWLAYSAEKQNKISLRREFLEKIYTEFPNHYLAPEAYFYIYSYREYINGSKKALHHLLAIPTLFHAHPILIRAYYIKGLYHKKGLISEEGEIIRQKDWTAAIDAFQLAEESFNSLWEEKQIPAEDLPALVKIRFQAQLERAQANLAIAYASKGGKKQIFLEYAEGVFKELIKNFEKPATFAKYLVHPQRVYPSIWAEAELKLAQLYQEKQNWAEAERLLNQSLRRYHDASEFSGHSIMRIWLEKGKIALNQDNPKLSLYCFHEATLANPTYVEMTSHEKLDLWIQESVCHQKLGQLDESMTLLSRVINEEVISSLRMKAMFLRAEIYEKQERIQLAIKQLEAIARLGGEWSEKANEKLEQLNAH